MDSRKSEVPLRIPELEIVNVIAAECEEAMEHEAPDPQGPRSARAASRRP